MKDAVHDPPANVRAGDSLRAPLAVLGVAAAVVGLTAYWATPARRSDASVRRRQALIAYLRDHLGGADMALRVVHHAAATHTGTDATLFRRLAREFEEDHAVVRTLLNRLGASARSIKRAAGYASGAVLSRTAGGDPGELSLLRTLEGLAIGVQGKRCLWRALQNLSGHELQGPGGESPSSVGGYRGTSARVGDADVRRDRPYFSVTSPISPPAPGLPVTVALTKAPSSWSIPAVDVQ
jgi:hypothetical protein